MLVILCVLSKYLLDLLYMSFNLGSEVVWFDSLVTGCGLLRPLRCLSLEQVRAFQCSIRCPRTSKCSTGQTCSSRPCKTRSRPCFIIVNHLSLSLKSESFFSHHCFLLFLKMFCKLFIVRIDCFEETHSAYCLLPESFESSWVLHLLKCLGDVVFQYLRVAQVQEVNESWELEQSASVLYHSV